MSQKIKQYDEDGLVIRINKEEEKRVREEIRSLVKKLLALSADKYSDLPIDNRLRDALVEGKRLTGNAHKRHLSFLVRLVHEQGFADIRTAHERIHHGVRTDPHKIRETENYRDRLLDGDKSVIDELLARFTDVDIQYLRQLARNANKEKTAELKRLSEQAAQSGTDFDGTIKPTKSSKLLYQYLFKLELPQEGK